MTEPAPWLCSVAFVALMAAGVAVLWWLSTDDDTRDDVRLWYGESDGCNGDGEE